ncbi:MAG: DMT family transporter [Duncaniella sp.]|nr:DMT family transporter [Duncaniella sp.]
MPVWAYHLAAAAAVTAWAFSFISTKMLLEHGLSPIEIYVYRTVIAYLALLTVCHKRLFANSLKDELLLVLCGLLAGSVYFISENVALEYTLVSNVSLITSLPPLLTVLLVGLLYKSNRPARGAYIGSAVAFIGVGLVIFNSSFDMAINPIGDLLSLLAAFCWSIYSLLLKPLNAHYDAQFITRKVFFYGVLTALPFMFIEPTVNGPSVLLNTDILLNFLFLGLVCSMLAYLLWAVAVLHIGAVNTSNYLYFQPIITMVASIYLLGERITVVGGTGCALILAGVWLADYLQKPSGKS